MGTVNAKHSLSVSKKTRDSLSLSQVWVTTAQELGLGLPECHVPTQRHFREFYDSQTKESRKSKHFQILWQKHQVGGLQESWGISTTVSRHYLMIFPALRLLGFFLMYFFYFFFSYIFSGCFKPVFCCVNTSTRVTHVSHKDYSLENLAGICNIPKFYNH